MAQATIKVDLKGVMDKLSDGNMKKGRYAMANQAWSDMNNYVPMKRGDLRSSSSVNPSGEQITYNMKYAKAQFYGSNGRATFRKYTVPGTGKRWDLKAKGLHMEKWRKAFVKGAGL